uniref:ribonuclease Z n=1 Tax=Heliconius erato TaxID=33431 RepID=L7WWB0_HELEA|nr:Ribonuclease Z-like protein [Heliconius erato]
MYGKIKIVNRVVRIYNIRYYNKDSSKKLLEFLGTMPKVNGKDGRIADSQRQRQLIAKKSEKFGASTVYLQVLGSGARGAPNTLYLFTDQKRYLFNCGEGTQRLAHEHKVKLSKLEQIFITNKTWNNIGGLPGLSLTLQDVGVPNITLHGPEGLKRLGTLDLEKCVEFGVKPGPMLGMLKNGQDVVLPDGTLVRSKDVKTPDDPGPVFIVMEVPDLSYLKESEFSAHFDNGANPPENIPTVIVHYTPPHVFNHPTYRAFLAMFGPTTRHLVLNRQNSCLGSESVHRTQHKLHLLDGEMFPLLRDTSMPALWDAPIVEGNQELASNPVKLKALEELKHNIALAQFQNIINMEGSCAGNEGLKDSDSLARLELIAGRTLTIFHLRPKKQLDRSMEPKLHIQEYIQEPLEVEGFVGSLERFRKVVEDTRYAKRDSQKEYPKVVFMGTGSCIPSKTRNTSGIVVHISEDRSMLLDCGEGTFGQLVRFYGPKKVNSFLRTLKAIYVSHLHADHHIGLIGVLQARHDAFAEINPEGPTPPLYLLAPGQIVTWLSIYHQLFEKIREEFVLVPNQNLLKNKQSDLSSAILSDIGKDSTLLIHEATMEDELADEARTKMHSTTSQAINIGKKMNAKYTVLTHFSQRYARLPRLNSHILNDNNSVGIAFDNMQITMSDLELLPHMYAPLQLMFADHCVELELKAEHRARQKEKKPIPAKMPASGTIRNYSTHITTDNVDKVTDTDRSKQIVNSLTDNVDNKSDIGS